MIYYKHTYVFPRAMVPTLLTIWPRWLNVYCDATELLNGNKLMVPSTGYQMYTAYRGVRKLDPQLPLLAVRTICEHAFKMWREADKTLPTVFPVHRDLVWIAADGRFSLSLGMGVPAQLYPFNKSVATRALKFPLMSIAYGHGVPNAECEQNQQHCRNYLPRNFHVEFTFRLPDVPFASHQLVEMGLDPRNVYATDEESRDYFRAVQSI